MRTLHADLTSAQQSVTGTPYITINVVTLDLQDSITWTTTDATNKISSVKQAEGTTNGHISIAGTGRDLSAVIRIRDADASIRATNYIGARVQIGWGFNTNSGNRVSYGSPAFVFRQRTLSLEGDVFVELLCISSWDLLSNTFASISTTGLIKYSADTTIRHILLDLMAGATPTSIVQHDGGVYTDYTTEAGNNTADNVILLSATPQINDAVYYGQTNIPFDAITHDLTTVGTGQIITWEYSTGVGTWAAFNTTNLVDGTDSFKTGELKITSVVPLPTNWVEVNLNSVDSAFPNSSLFYVRARVTTSGTSGSATTATRVSVGRGLGLSLDEATGSFNEDFTPNISVDHRIDNRDFVRQILNYTGLGVVSKNDGFHLVNVDPAEVTTVYEYSISNNHLIYSDITEYGEILPNQIILTSLPPDDVTNTPSSGSAVQTSSTDRWGTFSQLIFDDSVTSSGEGNTIAGNIRDRLALNVAQGIVVAQMNVGQEVWDYIRVVNLWTSVTSDAHITHILRTFEPGKYEIEIRLGGYDGIIDPVSLTQMRVDDINQENQDILTQQINMSNRRLADQIGVSNRVVAALRDRLDNQEFTTQITAMRILQERARTGELSQGVIDAINTAQAAQELQVASIEANLTDPNRIGEPPQVMTLGEILLTLTSTVSQGMITRGQRVPSNAPALPEPDTLAFFGNGE